MKSHSIGPTIILLMLGLIVSLSINTSQNFNSIEEPVDENLGYFNHLKSSIFSEKIHIDNNWTASKIAGFCSGNGTYSEPYVIEDLIIDGGGFGSCILIENSDDQFIIQNCTLYNSGGPFVYNYAGILLSNVTNGQLINNSCNYNSYGIYLSESPSVNIKGNNVTNSDFGISLDYSDMTTISNNNLSNNDYGISLWSCNTVEIIRNTLINNGYFGIRFFGNQNIISENIVNDCNGGILIQRGQRNIVSRNIVNNNAQGIYLDRAINNSITENTASYNIQSGIRLFNSRANELSENILNNNTSNGIILASYSNSNNLSCNNATNNQFGIYLHYSNDNTISRNGLIGNNICIYEESCQGNEFYDNGDCIPSNNKNNDDKPPAIDFNIILVLSGSVVVGIIVITEVRKFRKRK